MACTLIDLLKLCSYCFFSSIFDLINVHLFHDASNLLAAERSPSIYSKCRRNALKFTLESLPLDSTGKHVPYVIFGDFNFRLDAHRLVEVRITTDN